MANELYDDYLPANGSDEKKLFSEEVAEEFQALKLLDRSNGFFVQQEWEVLEYVTSCWEQQNEYQIFDKSGNLRLFTAREDTACCWRICCGEHRPFSFNVNDITKAARNEKGKKALVFNRSFRCCGCALIPGCAHQVDVHYMVDNKTLKSLGSTSKYTRAARVRVPFGGGCCWPRYNLEDYAGVATGFITGPFCFVCDCCGADFQIHDAEGERIGHIEKLRPANLREMAFELETEADNYQVKFEKEDIPFNIKLATLAATFLIDFNFFEDSRGLRQCRCCDMYLCGYALACVPACFCTYCCPCCKPGHKDKKGQRGAPEEMVMEV